MRSISLLALALLLVLPMTAACDNSSTRSDDQPTENGESAESESALAPPLSEAERQAALVDPSLANEEAPEQYRVLFETTKGDFIVEVTRDWAPRGADRLYNLARIGYFDDTAFFRVVGGFMAQFGIHGNPEISAHWRGATIEDDPVLRSNTRGKVTFAMGGPNTRTSQIFINYSDNSRLDGMGFPPVGEVVEGMEVVDSLYAGYGDGPPHGRGPNQQFIQQRGNEFLRADFPELDYITAISIVE